LGIAGKKYIFYDKLSEINGRVGDNCPECGKCTSDKEDVVIFEANSKGVRVWSQFLHKECFYGITSEDFFD
jgi:hypothetical protein